MNAMYCHSKSYSFTSSGTRILPESRNLRKYPSTTAVVLNCSTKLTNFLCQESSNNQNHIVLSFESDNDINESDLVQFQFDRNYLVQSDKSLNFD